MGTFSAVGDRPCRHALVAGLDQQAEQRQPMLLGKRAQRFDRGIGFHQRKFAQWIADAQQGVSGRALKLDATA